MADKQTLIKLRQDTGAPIVDIKEALEEAGNDAQKAIEILRKKGQKMAQKRAERSAGEGYIGSYVHSSGKVAAMVKLQCETDFVARNADFRELARDLAMHVTASNPSYVSAEDVPAEDLAKEKEIYRETLAQEGKPAEVIEKIMAGKVAKFYEETCLLNQRYIKDDSKTVKDLIDQATGKIGEKIEIGGFTRVVI